MWICESTISMALSRLALGLGDEEWDLARGLRLVFLVRRIGRDGQLPQSRPLRLVLHLADPHGLHGREIAELNRRVGAQVVYPDRVLRRSADRADEDVVGAVLDPHQ